MIKISHYKSAKLLQIIGVLLSLAFILAFAIWWFNPAHIPYNFHGNFLAINVLLFLLVSYVIWQPIMMEVLTWIISLQIKEIRIEKPAKGYKVAFITTIVPKKEPAEMLHKCLPAMVRASYKHDTWVLDEGNDEQVAKICSYYGVKHFSRFGIAVLNTATGKYTKTKGGNHNSWYDTFGDRYDIVAQIDPDFVPKRYFLVRTLGYFKDPKVAFVGTPQIYGNTADSVVALGASEQQTTFYGAVLRGLSSIGMTLLIGANHVIRVSAFKQVGHYTAHITEDLITGIKLHANGYKSVYVPTALAIGEGPATWDAYFNQQLRWAYGCIDILFHHFPRHLKKMEWRQAGYYLLLQQHYFTGVAMAMSIFLLCLYFVFGLRAANVDALKFFAFYSFSLVVCWLMSVSLQQYDIGRKKEATLLLYGKLITIAAWPIWFLAFLSVLTGRRLTYKVTPKGHANNQYSPKTLFIPHYLFAIVAFLGLCVAYVTDHLSPVMLFWGISCIFLMLFLPFAEYWIGLFTAIKQKGFFLIKKWSEIEELIPRHRVETEGGQNAVARHLGFIADTVFLCVVVAVSMLFYIPKLGFYSDDWSFIGTFATTPNKSWLNLDKIATTPNTLMRPLQNLYDSLLYVFFGTHPLGYQIVNGLVFTATIVVLYFVMRRMKVPRLFALSISVIYALIPNYSTDRFWYAAFQVNLSILFFLFSTYAGLMTQAKQKLKKLFWGATSLLALVASGLSYEVILPLSVLSIALYADIPEKIVVPQQKAAKKGYNLVFITVTVITLLYLFIFKLETTTRIGKFNYPLDVIRLAESILATNFGTLGILLPYIWGDILANYRSSVVFYAGFLLAGVVFVYLYSIVSKPTFAFPLRSQMRYVTLLGVAIFFLGYAIFLSNNKVGFSPTGIDNRVAIAASLGIAVTFVGAVGWLCSFMQYTLRAPVWLPRSVFCGLMAAMVLSGFLIITTLSEFWIAASQKQQAVLSDIHNEFPILPQKSTLILDGVCPYVGPGIVFESQWDLKGALQTMYHDPTLQADIVTPRLQTTVKGIQTQIYTFTADYPYKNLVFYNDKTKRAYQIANFQAAQAYFLANNPDHNNGCPQAVAGNGVTVF